MRRMGLNGVIILFFTIMLIVQGIAESATGRRVAPVIGNGAYAASPLKNPVSDAGDMAALLRSPGFEVISKKEGRAVLQKARFLLQNQG